MAVVASVQQQLVGPSRLINVLCEPGDKLYCFSQVLVTLRHTSTGNVRTVV